MCCSYCCSGDGQCVVAVVIVVVVSVWDVVVISGD